MAIKTLGISNNSLRVLYYLSKGGKSQKSDENGKGKRAGVDLGEEFRFESPNETISSIYSRHYQQNTRINIYLPFDAPEDNFDDWYENHGANGLEWRCDGEKIVERMKTLQGSFKGKFQERRTKILCEDPCLQFQGDNKFCPSCKPTGRLKFYIREIYHAGFIQCGLLTTSSKNDCLYLKEELKELHRRWGSLAASPIDSPETFGFIPWILYRIKQPINRFVNGQTIRKPYHGLAIAPDPDWVQKWLGQSIRQPPTTLNSRYAEMLRRVKLMLIEYGKLANKTQLPNPELFQSEDDLEVFGKTLAQELTILYRNFLSRHISDVEKLSFKDLQQTYLQMAYNVSEKAE